MSDTRNVIAALVALGLVFVGFSWWVWAAVDGLHWAIPVSCTLLPLLVVALVVVLPRLLAKRRAAGLEGGLSERGRSEAGTSAEVERLRREFDEAMTALKKSRLRAQSRDGRDALGILPWYAIIGPPACGKTTALRRSGLHFPHLKGTGARPNLKGLGGTRNLDWFLTDEAILVDTAGRWSVEAASEDRREWEAFLQLLRKHRPDKPLNGVVLAVSLAEQVEDGEAATVDDSPSILGLDDTGVRALAERMRERLDEVASELGVRLPVYLLFTKCDLLSGFIEMFGSMSEPERRQIWGFSARVGEVGDAPRQFFARHFEELVAQIERRGMRRLGEETQPAVLERILGFSGQLRALQGKLETYFETLAHDSAFSEAPMVRGAYFTCGTQEGAPAQAVSDELASALGIQENIELGKVRDESYFLHDVLRKVVFKDQDLATASDAELSRRVRRRRVWMGGVSAAALGVLLFSVTSYSVNRAILAQTQEVLKAVRSAPSGTQALWPLYREVGSYERGRPSLLASGFYPGWEMTRALRRQFAEQMQRRVVRQLYADNTAALKTALHRAEAFVDRGEKGREAQETRGQLVTALKLHVLLGRRGSQADETCAAPSPVKEQKWVIARLQQLWRERESQGGADTDERRSLMLGKYLASLSPNDGVFVDELAFRMESSAVARARRVLAVDDTVQRALAAVERRFRQSPIEVESMADSATFASETSQLSGAFSRDARRQVERDLSQGGLWEATPESHAECWVLGSAQADSAQRMGRLVRDFREAYLERYAAAWHQLLTGLATRSPSSLAEAETTLGTLPHRLESLFRAVQEHTATGDGSSVEQVLTTVGAKAPGAAALPQAAKDALAKVQPPQVSVRAMDELLDFTRFGVAASGGLGAGLEAYRMQLAAVLSALAQYRTDPTRIGDVATAADGALASVRQSLLAHGPYRTTLERLVLPPLERVYDLATGGREQMAQEQLHQAFCQEVYLPFQQQLVGKFPFRRDFGTEVRAEDIAEGRAASLEAAAKLLGPEQGRLWQFVGETLAGYVVERGQDYRFGERDGRSGQSVLRTEVLSFLKRARRLREALFAGGALEPRLRAEVTLKGGRGIAKSWLSVGGKTVAEYDNGPLHRVGVTWPGEKPEAGMELQVELDDGSRTTAASLAGPWALWLFADGTGCREAESSACRMSGRCDDACRWYGADAEQARKACGGRACYWGLHAQARARHEGRRIVLSVPVGRNNFFVHLDIEETGSQLLLSDPSLFDLRIPERVVQRVRKGCDDG